MVFATVGGLRGAVSLILAQTVLTDMQDQHHSAQDKKVGRRAAHVPYCILHILA